MSLRLCSPSVNGAVLQPARSHAEPERAAGGEDQDDRGQHPAAAGRAASDPGGAAEGAGTEPAGEAEELLHQQNHRSVFLCLLYEWMFWCHSFKGSQDLCFSFQMFLQKGAGGLNLNSVQMAQGNAVQQGGTLSMQGQVVSAGPLQNSIQQQHTVQPQPQQQTLLRDQSAALSQVRHMKQSSFS